MANKVKWQDESISPTEASWYTVMRADGSLCLRAWGNGNWWIPLVDGWLSGIPPGFKWIGPVMPITWNTPGSTRLFKDGQDFQLS